MRKYGLIILSNYNLKGPKKNFNFDKALKFNFYRCVKNLKIVT